MVTAFYPWGCRRSEVGGQKSEAGDRNSRQFEGFTLTHVHENRGFCIDFAIFDFWMDCLSNVYKKIGHGRRAAVNT